jgi:hypothetical protein
LSLGKLFGKMTIPTQDNARFIAQLRRQLGYLERSAALYDSGQVDEAIRIATTIRVLVHDTRNSTSLLSHLGAKTIAFATTAKPEPIPVNVLFQEDLVSFTARGLGAKTDPRDICCHIPVDQWWGQVVHIAGRDAQLTRRSIVLFAANQDGGTHVDEEVSPHGRKLLEGAWVSIWHDPATGEVRPEHHRNHHLVMLRTMAFEILHSPDIRKLAG